MLEPREKAVIDAARVLVEHWDDQDRFGADIIDTLRDAVHALDREPVAKPGLLVTSTKVESVGAHDRVIVWVRGGHSGALVVPAGDGGRIARSLVLGGDIAEMLSSVERSSREIRDVLDRIVAFKATVWGNDPWLMKDFNVLYRCAEQVTKAARSDGEDVTRAVFNSLAALAVHVERLRPAFQETEVVRTMAPPAVRDTPFDVGLRKALADYTPPVGVEVRDATDDEQRKALEDYEAAKQAGEGD